MGARFWTREEDNSFYAILDAHRLVEALVDAEAAKLVGQGVPVFDAVSQALALIRKRVLSGGTDIPHEIVRKFFGKEDTPVSAGGKP